MDSRVVQNQVHEGDEHPPLQVSPGAEEHNSDHESKSSVFMSKVKARAKKIRNSIKNIGHHSPPDGDLVEDKEIVEDHEEDAPTTPIYDTEAVKSATPAPEKEKNLLVSEVDHLGGTKDTGDGEDLHDHDQLVKGHSSTNEINQNIASEKPIVLEKELHEQGSRPEAYNIPNHQTKVTDPSGKGSDEINDITKAEESFERMNVQDDPKPIIEPKTQPSFAETEYPLAGRNDQFDPQTKTQYEPAKEETFNTITNTAEKQPSYESVETQPKHKDETEILEKDLHEQESRPEAYNLPNFQTEVTDPSGLAYDSEDVKNAALVSKTVEDIKKSEFDFEGTTDKRDEPHHGSLVEGLSSTTDINQDIATEKPRVLEKDLHEQGSRPEAYNLPNYQTEVTDPSGLAYDSEAVTSTPRTSEKVEDLRKSEIDFEGTTIKGDEPHHDPLVEGLSSSTEINQNIATEKPIVFENDPHQQGSILGSFDVPNHQTKVTDPSGKGSDEINDITKVEDSFERLNVQDEPKPIIEPKTQSTFAENEYPLAGRNDLFDPQTKTQYEPAKEETFNTITNTDERQPSYESVETQPQHKDETEILFAAARETFSTQNDEPSKLAHDEKDNRSDNDKVKETHDDYEKVMLELKEEVPETSTGDGVVTETNNEDKDHATARETFSPQSDEDSKLDHDVKETHDDYEKVMLELKEEVSETSTGGDVGTGTKNEDNDHATDRETYSPQNDEAYKLSHDVKETHDDYDKGMLELKEKVPETSTGGDVGTGTKNEDNDHATDRETYSPQNDEAYKLSHDVKETHNDYDKGMLELKEKVPETSTGGDVGTGTKNEDHDHATDRETYSPQNDEASKLSHDVKETHDDYAKGMLELKEEVPETSTGDGVVTETKNEDKDHAKGVPVKGYLAEKLRPGEDDKALSEVISEALHKKKEEPVKKEDVQLASGDEKSEKVSEEPNTVESPGKGYVDRFKGAVGSWFYTSEEKQSPQVAGDGDLSKSKDSVVEGERVGQVKNE